MHDIIEQQFATANASQRSDWPHADGWDNFLFNYNGAPSPPSNEIVDVGGLLAGSDLIEHIIVYRFKDPVPEADAVQIDRPILFLALSTTNSAHSLSELTSFINFYTTLLTPISVAVSSIISEKLPFLFGLLKLFVPHDHLLILDRHKTYQLKSAWIRRNNHMNYLLDWSQIPFTRDNNVVVFRDLASTSERYLDSIRLLLDKTAEICQQGEGVYPRYDKVMMIKTRADNTLTTPGRAMEISELVREQLEKAGIKVISINDFENIEQYLYTIHSARVFITSYGGPACTNRFFVNSEARVILLGNKHYASEYEYPNQFGELSHLRRSHLFLAREQIVILDHNDEIDANDVARIIAFASAESV